MPKEYTFTTKHSPTNVLYELDLNEANRVLTVSPERKLEAEDFAQLAEVVDPFLEENGPLRGLLIEAEDFPGWQDFAALISHLRFVKVHHTRIDRVAAVTDSGFLSVLPQVANHFIKAEKSDISPSTTSRRPSIG